MTITLEHLRADIAAILHEDPEEIGLDDNLIDLGLDSMRLMTLTLKWQEDGLALDFAALAECFTLAGWWEVISARQATA